MVRATNPAAPTSPSVVDDEADILAQIDQLILQFWDRDICTGIHKKRTPVTVTWYFPEECQGRTDSFPKQSPHEWKGDTWGVRQMARIDFYRGKQSDDRTNAQWKEWAKKLKNVWEESRLMNCREHVSAQWM